MKSEEIKKHSKHTSLIKPLGGEYHSNEWALIGAPCSVINQFAKVLNKYLSQKLKLGFIDADHNEADLPDGFYSSFTDKITYRSFSTKHRPGQKQNRKFFGDLDLLLINGNHFNGAKQIVFIDERKKDSLNRKLDRLTDVRLIVLQNKNEEVYDFVKEAIGVDKDVFVTDMSNAEGIANYLFNEFRESVPQLYGLVLAGGKSQRMGSDKGVLDYHGKAQREYQADLMSDYCAKTFISHRDSNDISTESEYKAIIDSFIGLGPYGGILSAFREQPNKAWMTIACDLPYMNKATINQLATGRDMSKVATCFYNPETQFPEPLITIWEPRAYPILLEFLSQGYSCPRKVLINSDIQQLEMEDTICMTNVNDKEAYDEWKRHNKNSLKV